MKYDTLKAIAVAIYAFQQNENTVVKFATTNSDGSIKFYANKNYLESTFGSTVDDPAYPLSVNVSAELLDKARELKTAFDYMVTMNVLTNRGNINKFVNNVYQITTKEEINRNEFSMLIWAPKIIADNEKTSAIRLVSAGYEHTSKFIGQVGNHIILNFNLIEKRYIRQIDCWSAYGYTDEGNLIKFLTKHEELCVSRKIKARIKDLVKDQYHNNALVTNLNHVKAA